MSIKTYQNAQDKATDPRRLEIMMFQKCNALLAAAERARRTRDSTAHPLAATKSAASALYENDRLWTTLVADVATDENGLDPSLRARLISLGLWACRYSDRVRADLNASFAPLIDLNAQMIEGLTVSLGQSQGQASPIPTASPEAIGPILT